VLSFTQREIATISALASMSGTQSQFQAHLNCGLNVGLTPAQLQDIVNVLSTEVNPQIATDAQPILDKVLTARK
ncbi:carboxymuconolactone decarboxylase family protein, partial [Phocaeicola coprophilus]|nr:carboxymuconolactone decarboxylase family protein [Phocaeicola coprophilus]